MDSQLPAIERLPSDWPEMTVQQMQRALFDASNVGQLLDVKELKELPLPKWFPLVVEVFATGSSRISNYSGALEPTGSARTDQVWQIFGSEPQLRSPMGDPMPRGMYVAKLFGQMTKDELLAKLEQLGDLAVQNNSGRPITRMHQVSEAIRYNWKNCFWFIVTIKLSDVLRYGGREWYNRFLYHVRRDKHVWLPPIIEAGYAAYKAHTEPSSPTA